jgi:hypothetical protein
MSAPPPRAVRAVTAFCLVVLLGLTGLVVAGGADRRTTAFSLDIPPAQPVAAIAPGRPACQGPLPVPAAFSAVRLWLGPVAPPGTTLRVTLRGSGGVVASGTVRLGPGTPTTATVALKRAVESGGSASLCFADVGARPITLLGDGAGPDSGTLAQGGHRLALAASALMLTPHPRSLLSLIPTVFARAALFRPAWLGAWTFWMLGGGVLIAFALAGVALARASRDELDAPAPSSPSPPEWAP